MRDCKLCIIYTSFIMNRLIASATSNPKSTFYLLDPSEIDLRKPKYLKSLKKSKANVDKTILDVLSKEKADNKNDENNGSTKNQHNLPKIPPYTPFVREKQNDNTTLTSTNSPFQRMQADLADLRFINPGIGPKYALLLVDVYTGMVFTYGLKSKAGPSILDKLREFYTEIWGQSNKYKSRDEIKTEHEGKYLQTDMEFEQKSIEKLNKKHGVTMFQSKMSQGHAFAAEQKIRELKKMLYTYLTRAKSNKSLQIKNKYKVLEQVTIALNHRKSEKYGWSPVEILQAFENGPSTAEAAYFNLVRAKRVEASYKRTDRYEKRREDRRKKRLSPLEVGDHVLVEAGRIRKSDVPGVLTKATTNKKSPFNREQIFTVSNKIKQKVVLGKTYFLYSLVESDTQAGVKGRFKREELFKL